jgi:squalene-hopene/tetraprenyl-beta-curcumene cyclase
MNLQVDVERVVLAHKAVRAELLADRTQRGYWVGQLASSPLATAAAISALVAAHRRDTGDSLRESETGDGQLIEQLVQGDLSELLCESVQWLGRQQNPDGGWGDCDTGHSNLAATMLVQAAFRMTGVPAKYADLIARADQYISVHGGAAALRRNAALDKSLIAAILAQCALAGIVSWRQVPSLPFEVVCIPKQWRQWRPLPYPRYATPALIAVGRAKFHHDPPRNPLMRILRRSMCAKSLAVLESLQAADDSFLGSIVLTAFVVTSLASSGGQDHAIVQRGIEFLLSSVRGDASWSIKNDLAITNTALALNALSTSDRLASVSVSAVHGDSERGAGPRETHAVSLWPHSAGDSAGFESPMTERCLAWLLENQRTGPDPLTQVPPGGWAWSDAPGALPNTPATAGVVRALIEWPRRTANAKQDRVDMAVRRGIRWLLDLQYDDGGWPTFYRDDGDFRQEESSIDATAGALRALHGSRQLKLPAEHADMAVRVGLAIDRGWRYLESQQREDGRFVSIWFGNEYQPGELNPVYGTAAVLMACGALDRLETELARRAAHWLESVQHATGGWGPPKARRDYSGAEKDGFRAWRANEAMAKHCSVEETALAVAALLPLAETSQTAGQAVSAGLTWLTAAVEQDAHRRPAVIGYYHTKLWYHERLYPLVFAAGAFSRALGQLAPQQHEIASIG